MLLVWLSGSLVLWVRETLEDVRYVGSRNGRLRFSFASRRSAFWVGNSIFSCMFRSMQLTRRAGEDKARDRARVREKHLKRRLKSKDKDDDAAGAPTLAGSSSSDSDANGSSSSSSGASDTSDDDNDDKMDSPSIVGIRGSDSSDEEEMPKRGRRKAGGVQGVRGEGSSVPEGATELSLEEQEDEVLAMLAARQRK